MDMGPWGGSWFFETGCQGPVVPTMSSDDVNLRCSKPLLCCQTQNVIIFKSKPFYSLYLIICFGN